MLDDRGRLDHRLAVGGEAGEQDGRLHLGARDRERVVDPVELARELGVDDLHEVRFPVLQRVQPSTPGGDISPVAVVAAGEGQCQSILRAPHRLIATDHRLGIVGDVGQVVDFQHVPPPAKRQ